MVVIIATMSATCKCTSCTVLLNILQDMVEVILQHTVEVSS